MALELSKNRSVNILVFSAIIGVIFSAIALWYSTDQKSRINGASLLAASDKYGVIFSMDKSFYHTDADARVIDVVTYESLGLKRPLADIAFGQDGLYVIEAREHIVKKCTIPLGQCQSVGFIPGSTAAIAMDIAVTPDNKHFYVSNSSLHRVDKFSIDGTYLYRLKVGESFNYPNDLVAIDDTTIAVADSVNHRIVAIDDKGLNNSRIVWQLNVKDVISPLGLDWPSALHFSPNGRLWVNNQNYYFNVGEIVVYDAVNFSFLEYRDYLIGEKVMVDYTREIVKLNDGAEPRNFASLGDKMLIGNFNPIELLAMEEGSLGVRSFVDGLLQNEFGTLSDNRQHWLSVESTSKLGIGLFVVLLLFAAFLEVKEGKKQAQVNRPGAQCIDRPGTKLDRYLIEPDKNGIVWLEIQNKMLKHGVWVLYIAALVFAAGLGLLYFTGEGEPVIFLIFVVAAVIMFSIALYGQWTLKRVRLGRDEKKIYIVNWLNKSAAAPFEEACFTGKRIIIDDIAIGVVDGHGNDIYDKKEFKTYIKPLLEQMKQKSEIEIMFEKLKSGDMMTWFLLLVGIPLVYLAFYVIRYYQ